MLASWINRMFTPVSRKVQKLKLMEIVSLCKNEEHKEEKKKQTEEAISKCWQEMNTFILPYIEKNFLSDKKFLVSNNQTPVDYLLYCELNQTLVLLNKCIDKDKFPRIYAWRDAFLQQPETMKIRD